MRHIGRGLAILCLLPSSRALAQAVEVRGSPKSGTLVAGKGTVTAYVLRGGTPLSMKVRGPASLTIGYRRDMGPRATKNNPATLKVVVDGSPRTLSISLQPDSAASVKGYKTVLSREATLAADIAPGAHTIEISAPAKEAGYAWVVTSSAVPAPASVAAASPETPPISTPAAGFDFVPLPAGPPPPVPAASAQRPKELGPGAAPAAPAIASAAPPLPAAAAQEPSGSEVSTRTLTARADVQAIDTTGPAAQATSPPPAGMTLSVSAIIQRVTEQPADRNNFTGLAVGFTRPFNPRLSGEAAVGLGYSSPSYQSIQSPDGSPRVAPETRFDLWIGARYHLAAAGARMRFDPGLALRVASLVNEAFPANFVGIALGLRIAYDATSSVAVAAQGAFTYDFLAGAATLSVAGSPAWLAEYGLAVEVPLAAGFKARLGYAGEALAFKTDLRVAHGARLDLSFAL